MKHPYGIALNYCVLGVGKAEECVQWAEDALIAGDDSRSLRMLAGLEKPLYTFEVRNYTQRALEELGLYTSDHDEVITRRSYEFISAMSDQGQARLDLLETLKNIDNYCVEHGLKHSVRNFMLLYWAYEDFHRYEDEFSHYWPAATKDNIEDIILDECKVWLKYHPEFER